MTSWTRGPLAALAASVLLCAGAAGCGSGGARGGGAEESPSPVGKVVDRADEEGRPYREVAQQEAPEVGVEVRPDADGSWDVRLTVRRFRFSPAGTVARPTAGRGLAHLLVDGRLVGRLRTPDYRLPARLVPRGTHHVTARLYADDDTVWAVAGRPVQSTADITASGLAPGAAPSGEESSPGVVGTTGAGAGVPSASAAGVGAGADAPSATAAGEGAGVPSGLGRTGPAGAGPGPVPGGRSSASASVSGWPDPAGSASSSGRLGAAASSGAGGGAGTGSSGGPEDTVSLGPARGAPGGDEGAGAVPHTSAATLVPVATTVPAAATRVPAVASRAAAVTVPATAIAVPAVATRVPAVAREAVASVADAAGRAAGAARGAGIAAAGGAGRGSPPWPGDAS
ncbi:hypothetical protein ACF1BS_22275 [Streptomyces sp. NPDC014748]|uniref:hypothetical protein n=1 Tax=Streptomyces sp. NPDC014748 TaxID=3364905 RepID=UPI0036FE250A